MDIRKLRKKLGLNQEQFWRRVSTTQSGGSRYESGRAIPESVQRLIGAVYLGKPVLPYQSQHRVIIRRYKLA